MLPLILCFFFFNDTATTEIYTLSLHDPLPILVNEIRQKLGSVPLTRGYHVELLGEYSERQAAQDRKSTRLNSSHVEISYAVFCLKKKIDKYDRHLSEQLKHPEPPDAFTGFVQA